MTLGSNTTIAVVGLGYVGLPLAVEFGKKFRTIGYDLSEAKVAAYKEFSDPTGELSGDDLRAAPQLECTTEASRIGAADFIVVAVPTPIDQAHQPDFSPLVSSSTAVGKHMKRGAIVIYESTVYPGATEEICIPVLEKHSGMKWQQDFHVGYSPERINPGDKEHRLPSIKKVTSGSTPAVAAEVDALYRQVVTAGTHLASSIKVAEAAKVIENTQRDVNIALMNELSLIFRKLDIDTLEVLQAAGTKWNFLPFRPGLVGGHCIGVDPYYLTHKAQEVGHHPEVILAGRRINDGMAAHVADQTVKLMLRKGHPVLGSKVLVLGLTFKENCPDLRNTKVVDIVSGLRGYHAQVDVYDPWIDRDEALHEYGLQCLPALPAPAQGAGYDAIVLAVGHHEFVALGETGIKALGRPGAVVYDVKSILPLGAADGRL